MPWDDFPEVVLMDFDGLMVDTEWAIYESWLRVYREHGQDLPLDMFNQCLGAGYSHWDPAKHLDGILGKTLEWEAIHRRRQDEIERDLSGAGVMDGVVEMLEFCRGKGVRLGVVSSSSHRWVDGWLKRLDLWGYFETVVCRDDGFPVKPDPALYLEAARRLEVDPAVCLVFEDSRNGVVAAKAAGMRAVAIPNRVTRHAEFGIEDLRVGSMREVLPE